MRFFICALFLGAICAVANLQAQDQFPIQVLSSERDQPPSVSLYYLCSQPELRHAALAELKCELLGEEKSPNPLHSGLPQVHLRTEDGAEYKIVLGALFTEQTPGANWGNLIAAFPEDQNPNLSDDQRNKGQELCRRLADVFAHRIERSMDAFCRKSWDREMNVLAQYELMAASNAKLAEVELTKLQEELQNLELTSPLSTEALEKQLVDVMSQRQNLTIEIDGLESRRSALEMQIAKSTEVAEKAVQDDEVVKNLERVVELRHRELAVVKQQIAAGQATARDRESVEIQLVTSQADLAEARRTISAARVGAVLDQLRIDLAQTVVRLEECRARQESVKRQLDELAKQHFVSRQSVEPLRDRVRLASSRAELLLKAKNDAGMERWRLECRMSPIIVRLLTAEPANRAAAEQPAQE